MRCRFRYRVFVRLRPSLPLRFACGDGVTGALLVLVELSLLRRVVLCQPRLVKFFDLGALLPVFGVRDVFRLVRREGRIGVEQLDDSFPSLADQVELFGAAQGGCRIAGRV